jgi:hypothetical protein
MQVQLPRLQPESPMTQELRLIGTSKRSHRSQTWGSICWCGGGTQGPSSIQMSLGWLGNSWAARRHRLESSGYSAKLTGRIAAWLKHRFGFGFGFKKSNFKSTCGTIQFNYCPLALFYIVHSRMNWFTFTLSARNFSCAMYQPGSLVGKKLKQTRARLLLEPAEF